MKWVCLIVLLSATASADSTHYIEGGVMVGGAKPVVGANLMASVTVGTRLSSGLWLRGLASFGRAVDFDEGGGTNGQLRAGIEVRDCTSSGHICFVPALDLGVQHGRWDGSPGDIPPSWETITALVAVPAVAVELGDTIKWRVGFELDVKLAARQQADYMPATAGGVIGGELTVGVGQHW